MKIRINYDLMSKVLDVNQKPGIFKIVRYRAKLNICSFGIFALLSLIFGIPLPDALIMPAIISFGVNPLNASILLPIIYKDKDPIKKWAMLELLILSLKLNSLHLSTTPELLAQSEEYETKYKIHWNESKIPFLAQEKYILVPNYSEYDGQIRKTSILQEHILGTSKYDLSLGSPQKTLKLAYHPI